MTFWSGETIRQRLNTLVDKPDAACIDGAAYALKVGPEYYVSPTDVDSDRNTRTVMTLAPEEAFTIPAGRFALVLTEEIVTAPKNALGFFSIRSRVKWKGLVNVSGFHIDPGFCGRLTIAVYNAGPTPIHLRRGDAEFLIWFADLDAFADVKDAKRATEVRTQISANVLNQAPGESESLPGLSAKIRDVDKTLQDEIRRVDRELREKINALENIKLAAAIVLTVMTGLTGYWLSNTYLKPAAPQAPTAVSAPDTVPVPPPAPAKK
ncbi:MAG: deoxycytidine triphosphate deaminase [Alphaproteobacteria bacterium]|nr:MAG: deoxycytidine triphosphate deaminase [Alphaproteobacteria bacterium]